MVVGSLGGDDESVGDLAHGETERDKAQNLGFASGDPAGTLWPGLAGVASSGQNPFDGFGIEPPCSDHRAQFTGRRVDGECRAMRP